MTPSYDENSLDIPVNTEHSRLIKPDVGHLLKSRAPAGARRISTVARFTCRTTDPLQGLPARVFGDAEVESSGVPPHHSADQGAKEKRSRKVQEPGFLEVPRSSR